MLSGNYQQNLYNKRVPTTKPIKKNRFLTLDYLRGFFIVVIIVDHLSRWPSLFAIVSGKALLWVTAAEGFVAISGLLVGYVRGFKNKDQPMRSVAKKLLLRAGLLYLWSLIASIAYAAIIWYVPLKGGAPWVPIPVGDWQELITQLITMKYTFVWVHFLTLYALFLAAAPIAVWLLRKGLAWVVAIASFAALIIGWNLHNEALQWQFLFFIPTIAGYYLDSIMNWWKKLTAKTRHSITTATLAVTGLTIGVSIIATFYPAILGDASDTLNALFAKDTISLWRAGIAFLWFGGFILLFSIFGTFIQRFFGWLLLPIGTHSLTAYILHGVAICAISFVGLGSENILANTLLGATAILITWGLLKVPFVRKVIPS